MKAKSLHEDVPHVSMDPRARYALEDWDRAIITGKLTDAKISAYIKAGRYGHLCEACGRRVGAYAILKEGKYYHRTCLKNGWKDIL